MKRSPSAESEDDVPPTKRKKHEYPSIIQKSGVTFWYLELTIATQMKYLLKPDGNTINNDGSLKQADEIS